MNQNLSLTICNVFAEEGKNFKDSHFFSDDNDKPKEYERFKGEELKEIITIKAKEKDKEKEDKYSDNLYWSTPLVNINSKDILDELSEL